MGDEKKLSIFANQSNAEIAFDSVRAAVLMLDLFDWAEVREKMQHAHSVGHIVDPTGYRSLIDNKNVEANAEIAAAVVTFLGTLRDIKARYGEGGANG